MENLRVLKNYKEMSNDELIKDIDKKLAYLQEEYEGILTQQEIQTIKLMSIEEVNKAILENQKEIRESLNLLVERMGK